jgi:hypothetical protein
MEGSCAPGGCLWDNCQPCDAPDSATAWAWTVFGNPPNANTSDVAAYLSAFGTCSGTAVPDVSVTAGEHPDWGQTNNGNHNGAISQAGDCIEGLDVPVLIVGPPVPPATTCTNTSDTDGRFMGRRSSTSSRSRRTATTATGAAGFFRSTSSTRTY